MTKKVNKNPVKTDNISGSNKLRNGSRKDAKTESEDYHKKIILFELN